MRVKPGFKLRTVVGEQIIVPEGKENIDFSQIISMNESSAYLWEAVGEEEFTPEDLAKLLLEEYDVDEETALTDAKAIAEKWLEVGIAE